MSAPRVLLASLLVLAAATLLWWWWPSSGPAPAEERAAVAQVVATTAAEPAARALPPDLRSAFDAGEPWSGARAGQVGPAMFGWGSGPGELGRSAPQEGNAEAPMSLAVDGSGSAWIVDQVNGRLMKVDRSGATVSTVPLPVQAAQDIAVAKDGTMAVMDRLADKAVALVSPSGEVLGELKLQGKGLAEPGGATGVFIDGDDVYAEREHGDMVRLGSTRGVRDAERPEVPGRPSRDGHSWLSAAIGDRQGGTVLVTVIDRPSRAHRFTRSVSVGQGVVAIDLLDSDASGVIYLGALVELEGSTPEQPRFGIAVLCLDPLDGRSIGRASTDANTVPGETFRELVVPDEGGVVFLRRTEQSARLERLTCG
jgi:hypothetical protein